MVPDAPSPFVEIPKTDWLCANALAFAIYDRFPVSPGHVLVITRRVVPTYFDCTAEEQAALMELVGEVKRLLDQREPKPNGYNVGFNSGTAAGQTVPHVHVHVIPRYAGDMPDPRGGVRHVIPEKGNYLTDIKAPGGSPGTAGADAAQPSMQTRDRPTARSPVASAPGLDEPRVRLAPQTGSRVVEAYRDLRADLARRPTMTELFHRGYNPRTLPPEFTTWFDFVAAEGDATALEAECLGRFRDWFVMLATTRMTKSFQMVLLRKLLDRDALPTGHEIPRHAAA